MKMFKNLVPSFASVADRQYHNPFSVVVTEGNMGSMPEFNHPLAKLRRHFFDRATDFRVPAKQFDAPANRLDGALGGVKVLRS